MQTSVVVDIGGALLDALKATVKLVHNERAMKATSSAFRRAASMIKDAWANWAMGDSIDGARDIRRPDAALASSIGSTGGGFEYRVGTNNPTMQRIVQGFPPYDMKTTYPYATKSRVSKKGVPYLIIPFRWGTNNKGAGRAHFSNTIPAIAQAILDSPRFRRSYTKDTVHIEANAKGDIINRVEYDWGDRLQDTKENPNAIGMVKMGGKGQTSYYTFRVISARSPSGSWIKKAVPPNDIPKALNDAYSESLNAMVEAGLKADIG